MAKRNSAGAAGAKSHDNSTVEKKLSTFSTLTMSYSDIVKLNRKPKTRQEALDYANQEIEWARKEDSLNFTMFYFLLGIDKQTWHNWMDEWPELKKAHGIATHLVGERRERFAIFSRKYGTNPETIHKSLRNYEPTWRETYDEDVANKVAPLGTTTKEIQVVEMESFTPSNKTPEQVAIKAKASTKLGSRTEGKTQRKRDNSL